MQGGGRIKIGEREIEFLYEISGRKYRREFFFVESSYRCKLEARLNNSWLLLNIQSFLLEIILLGKFTFEQLFSARDRQ